MAQHFMLPELPEALNERQPWGRSGIEPLLCEMLTDPIVQAVMWRDGVTDTQLLALIDQVRQARIHNLLQGAQRYFRHATQAMSSRGDEFQPDHAQQDAADEDEARDRNRVAK